jgi:mRNA interferase MazF
MTGPKKTLPQRGEVWTVRFDPSVGAEMHKLRPAVVVNVPEVGRLPLRIVVPLTDWKPAYASLPWFVRVPATPQNGLAKDSGADAFQVKSVATARFVNQLGTVTEQELNRIVAAIALCIGFSL